MKKTYLIEGYRFIVALSILVFHIVSEFEGGSESNGRLGVEFFFILSGFLLMKHLEKSPEDTPVYITAKKIKSAYPYIFVMYLAAAIVRSNVKGEPLLILLYNQLHQLLFLTNALIGKASPLSGTGQLWFVMSQIWATLILAWLMKNLKNNYIPLLALLGGGGGDMQRFCVAAETLPQMFTGRLWISRYTFPCG